MMVYDMQDRHAYRVLEAAKAVYISKRCTFDE